MRRDEIVSELKDGLLNAKRVKDRAEPIVTAIERVIESGGGVVSGEGGDALMNPKQHHPTPSPPSPGLREAAEILRELRSMAAGGNIPIVDPHGLDVLEAALSAPPVPDAGDALAEAVEKVRGEIHDYRNHRERLRDCEEPICVELTQALTDYRQAREKA